MKHYTTDQWYAYTLGSEENREVMDDHLLVCEACLSLYLSTVEDVADSMPALPDVTAFSEGILKKRSPSKTVHKRSLRPFLQYAIAASITIILVSSGVFQQLFDRYSDLNRDSADRSEPAISQQLTEKAGQWLDSLAMKQQKKEGKNNDN